MIKEIIIYFALGIVGDILITLYYLFVGKLQAFPASFLAVLITLLNFFIIERVVVTTNWMLMVVYALGSAVGCFSIIFAQKEKLKRKEQKNKSKKYSKK